MKVVLLFILFCLCQCVQFQQGLDLAEARKNIVLSFAAYCPTATISGWNCYWCNSTKNVDVLLAEMNTITNTLSYVALSEYQGKPRIYVVFRGTVETSIANWWEDLDVNLIAPYLDQPSVLVHQGFYLSWQSIKPQVLQAIALGQKTCNCNDITFSGHSLGGGMAVLAAMDFYRETTIKANVTTLGCPRVGNPDFANYFNATLGALSTRMVNKADIVPHIPLQSEGYHHVRTEYWFKNGTENYLQCNGSGEDPSCSDSLFLIQTTINDHMTYLQIPLSDGYPFNCGGPNAGQPAQIILE